MVGMRTNSLPILSVLLTFALVPGCGDSPAEGNDESSDDSGDDSTGDDSTGSTSTTTGSNTATESQGDGDGDGDGDSSTGDGDSSTGDGDGDGEPVDCANLPAPVITPMTGAIASAGIAFDNDGNMFGSDTNSLFATRYGENATLLVPGLGGRGHMAYLPNDDLAMVIGWESQVIIAHSNGSTEPPMAWLDKPYGLELDPEGRLLIADNDRLYRVDLGTGNPETLLTSQDIPKPRVVRFDGDHASLFIGMESTYDTIYRVNLDGNGGLEEPMAWATLGGVDQPWVDDIRIDECGNVYVAEYWAHSLYRIAPEGGTAEVLIEWTEEEYGHALTWGSGIDGWKETALYLPQPYNNNRVVEVDLGLRSIHAN
jgi:sugar lactone lactonase YvrE